MLPNLRTRLASGVLLVLVAVLAQGCLVWRYSLTPDVTGNVRDAATTKPIPGATVSMRRKQAGGGMQVDALRTTSAYGGFRLPALHAWRACPLIPGDYWSGGILVVEVPGYRVYEQAIGTFGGGKLFLPHPIELEPEGSISSNLPPRPEPPKFTLSRTAPPDRALVYVFRPDLIPLFYKPTILLNDVAVTRLGGKEYVGLELPPGSYTMREHWSWDAAIPDSRIRLQVERGQSYYLMIDTRVVTRFDSDFNDITSQLELLPGNEAPKQMAPCRPAKKVLDLIGGIHPQ